jgi:hypothetical protein
MSPFAGPLFDFLGREESDLPSGRLSGQSDGAYSRAGQI